MGLFRFLRSVIDQEFLGDETVKKQEIIYKGQQEMFPNHDPHFYLAQVWISRMTAKGHDPNDPNLKEQAIIDTILYACVQPPKCARALGLYFLYKENPDIIEKFAKFQTEFNSLMKPVFEAEENGTMYELYKLYNPNSNFNDQAE